ncbi:ETC complex I subunit conserved region-domain-containing protein [Choanephora cucurbitarum]|nr:ETC complex I subunit conserved region-domain-containing protein [Choanephora cucurbitarum]
MSSPLINRTALLCRSTLNKPATLSALRFSSTQTKDVQHLENQPVLSVDNLSGAPEDLLERTVRIFKPSRSASQQGKNGTRLWRIDFDILEDGNRWENPLMGWASSSDYQQALTMKFISKEDAIRFAEKQGWHYYVQEPKTTKFVKKAYADNYLYSPNKLRMFKTK